MSHAAIQNTAPRRRWHPFLWIGAAVLLAVPAVAMQFTDEVDWEAEDFIAMGIMLAVLCALIEVGARMSDSIAYRAATAIAAGTGFLVVWVNLAVGFIGDEDNPANLLLFIVHLIGILGAALSRLRARGLMWTLLAMAAAQAAIAVAIAANGWDPRALPPSVVLIVLWTTSAILYRHAAADDAAAVSRRAGPA